MSTLKINGTSLEYAECGEGDPLILVHGSASDHRTWHQQQEEFADRYRVITLFVSNAPKPLEFIKLLVTRPRTAIAVINFGGKGMTPATAATKAGDVKKAMRLFGRTILGPQFYHQLSERRLEQIDANSIRAEFLGSGFVRLDAAQIRNVHVSTLLITGKYSHTLFHRLADRLEELLPNNERTEIDGASHIRHEDNAPVFNQVVESFLANKRHAV